MTKHIHIVCISKISTYVYLPAVGFTIAICFYLTQIMQYKDLRATSIHNSFGEFIYYMILWTKKSTLRFHSSNAYK